ncbi:MAG: YbhB/YbcL family Raf kinase inhibitor-like protein [Micrococcales bacterium]|nr:YbhB/YbcL family Raf kinase inhibitor-like protein [Micrococcales bacterium]
MSTRSSGLTTKERHLRLAASALSIGLLLSIPGAGALAESRSQAATAAGKLTVVSAGIVRGVIGDEYGARGPSSNGVPTKSLPIKVTKAPKGTKYYAVLMVDPDSKPLCGYVWRHWMAVNIKAKNLKAGASKSASMVQGVNDFGTVGYGGPTPPDKKHTYQITVYALKGKVALTKGFDLSIADFKKAIKGKVLAKKTIKGTYTP